MVTEVARSLEFSDKVLELADRVIHGMTMAGKYEYNAVHLRIEKDARDWSQIMGGEQVQSVPFVCCGISKADQTLLLGTHAYATLATPLLLCCLSGHLLHVIKSCRVSDTHVLSVTGSLERLRAIHAASRLHLKSGLVRCIWALDVWSK